MDELTDAMDVFGSVLDHEVDTVVTAASALMKLFKLFCGQNNKIDFVNF